MIALPQAILSTTILPIDGLYAVLGGTDTQPVVHGSVVSPVGIHYGSIYKALAWADIGIKVSFGGIPHYVGHPATQALIEALGAIPAPTRLFPGLLVGQAALTVGIRQGRSARANLGHTEPHQEVTWEDLEIRVLLRCA